MLRVFSEGERAMEEHTNSDSGRWKPHRKTNRIGR